MDSEATSRPRIEADLRRDALAAAATGARACPALDSTVNMGNSARRLTISLLFTVLTALGRFGSLRARLDPVIVEKLKGRRVSNLELNRAGTGNETSSDSPARPDKLRLAEPAADTQSFTATGNLDAWVTLVEESRRLLDVVIHTENEFAKWYLLAQGRLYPLLLRANEGYFRAVQDLLSRHIGAVTAVES